MDPQLLSEAKKLAVRSHRTLTAVIEDAVREAIARRSRPGRRGATFTVVDGQGLAPGLDLDDSASLLETLERDRDPA